MGTPSPPHWAHRGPWGLSPMCTPQLIRLEKSQHPRFETSRVFPLEAFREHWDSQVQDFVPNGFLGQMGGWHWLGLELLRAVPFPTRRPVWSSSVFLTALQRLEREQVSFRGRGETVLGTFIPSGHEHFLVSIFQPSTKG